MVQIIIIIIYIDGMPFDQYEARSGSPQLTLSTTLSHMTYCITAVLRFSTFERIFSLSI